MMSYQTRKNQRQKNRFVEKARELGADESSEAFERLFSEVVPPRYPKSEHASDCAIHNAPAYEPGRCDCHLARGEQ